jgi:hypothetical protein
MPSELSPMSKCVLLGIVLIPSMLHAQVAEISPDTGRMRPAHADFSRYTPGMCLDASRNVQHRTDRVQGAAVDTIISPDVDTLSTATVQVSRACAQQFRVAQVPATELRNLLWLSVRANDEQTGLAVIERQLALAQTVADKGEVLRDAIEIYLAEHPPRLSLAVAALQRLDALGTEARIPRIRARIRFLAYYRKIDDLAGAKRTIDTLLALHSLVTPEDAVQGVTRFDLLAAYKHRMEMAMETDPPSIRGMLEGFITLLQRVEPSAVPLYQEGLEKLVAWWLGPIGARVETVTGKYTFNMGATKTRPYPGKVSLLLMPPNGWRDGMNAYGFYEAIRHLHAQHGNALDITLCVKTIGWMRGSGVLKPAEEAEAIREYLLDYQKLPVTLIVDEAEITVLPDGRRKIGPAPFERHFGGQQGILVGRDGAVQRVFASLQRNRGTYRTIASVLERTPQRSDTASQ